MCVLMLYCILGSEILVNPFTVDLNHGCVGTCTQTLNLLYGEEAVRSGLARMNTEGVFEGLDDFA